MVTAVDGKKRARPIIVRFTSYRDRQRVFKVKKQLKNTGVTICEDLTRRRHQLYRQAVERHGEKRTWTSDGRILWITEDGRKGAETRMADLDHGNESIRVSVPTPCLGGPGSRIAGPHDSAHTPRPVCPFPPIAPPAPP
ncbi:hypothetical protein J6590_076494 [Homalodisca vitripennis]|nr:hypothetical protein J6590_076494 [Homalodisca vitripennis]